MKEKTINSFSIYAEYMDLFELLPTEEERGQLIWKILKYMFYDEIPVLNDNQTRIFNNLKRPLDKSKKKSNKNQNEIKTEPKQNQNETKSKAHQDVNVNVNVDVNGKKEDRVIGEEEKKEEKIHFAEFVSMTNAEYEKLVSTYGKKSADQCIQTLDNYKGSSGKKYKSDYRAILSWVVDKLNLNSKSKNPEWFDKDLKNEEMSEEDKKELDEILSSIEKTVGGENGKTI